MRVLSLSNDYGSLYLNGAVQARLPLTGTGMPPVAPQWFEGAGDGATWRGSRTLSRTMTMPVKVTGVDRSAVWAAFSQFATMFDPNAGEVTVTATLDGANWFTKVVRTGGGDFDWSSDTDGSTTLLTSVSVMAGDPYWTQSDEESLLVSLGGLGRGLLKGVGSFSKLQLSTASSLGSLTIRNTGDVAVAPIWIASAPFTKLTLTSPIGEVVEWTGNKLTGSVVVDMDLGTVVDEAGVNQYDKLNDVPQFWKIPPGTSVATVEAADASAGTWEPAGDPITNLATDPSFELPSGTVTVRTNYCTNPNFEGGTTGWNATNSTLSASTAEHHSGTQSLKVVTDGTANAGAYSSPYQPLTGWASTDDEIVGTWVKAPVGALLQVLLANIGGGAPLTAFTGTGDWQFVASPTQKVGASTSGPYVVIRTAVASSPVTFYVDDAGIEKSTVLTDTFNGATPAAGDFSYALAGDGTSIQTAPGVAGAISAGGSVTVQSSEWVGSGLKSARIIPTTGSNATAMYPAGYIGMTLGMVAGKAYTAVIKCRLAAPLTGQLGDYSRQLLVALQYSGGGGSSATLPSDAAPNVAGVTELRLTFAVQADTVGAAIILANGASAGNGDVWWDDLMIVEVPDVDHPYTGPYFDGNKDNGKNGLFAWTGDPDASTSTRFDSVKVGETDITATWRPKRWVMF